ncbi:aspartate-semialdehyde dehydrogenase [Bacteroidota bacterium]
MKVAVVGATGMVGREMLKVLEERKVVIDELIPVASAASAGKKVSFQGSEYTVVEVAEAVSMRPDVALFSAGGSTSLEWAKKFGENGTVVIDNSSAWRMDPEIPLVIPEVNFDTVTRETKLIANPNCSTIQLIMALAPLHKAFTLKRVIISTYQSVTGTGKAAVQQLEDEENGVEVSQQVYAYPIHRNCIPHCDVFLENGYTKEEMKLVNESQKILKTPNLKVTATAVRVPVVGGHSESVNITVEKSTTVKEIQALLSKTEGVQLLDDPANLQYPMPVNSKGKDDTFVGRIRKDESADNSFNLWIVADNLRKGAATNAVQIMERMVAEGFFKG